MSGMNLTEFLLARIAEDEADAREKLERWPLANDLGFDLWGDVEGGAFDPAHVLAECAAKRRIITDARHASVPQVWAGEPPWGWDIEQERLETAVAVYEDVLTVLAQPYSDHPDFGPSWRVDLGETP